MRNGEGANAGRKGSGEDTTASREGGSGRGWTAWSRRLWPLAILLAVLLLAYGMGGHHYVSLSALAESRDSLQTLVAGHPLMAPLVFAIAYALAVAVAFPAAWMLTVFGGFLFGWALSSLLVSLAATAGASVLFLSARHAFGHDLRHRLSGRVARLADGFENNAFAYLLALRLAPVLPFFLINIAPAFFAVRLRTYVGATFLGILPGVVAYSWLGQGLESALLAAEARGGEVTAADLATTELTIGLALIALVAAAGAIIKGLRSRNG
jgi:uncharacterized membrane protein YdjX (TVP38/TMEM64 family)